jgi:hypothetical protein
VIESSSRAAVVIIKALDVILIQITTSLDLDQFEINFAGVLQPVLGPNRNVGGFILVHDRSFVIHYDPRRLGRWIGTNFKADEPLDDPR